MSDLEQFYSQVDEVVASRYGVLCDQARALGRIMSNDYIAYVVRQDVKDELNELAELENLNATEHYVADDSAKSEIEGKNA